MSTLANQLDSALALTGIAQSLFFAGLLQAEGPRAQGANRWLQVFLLATAFSMAELLIEGQDLYVDMPWLFLSTLSLNFLLAPSIILYLMSLSGEPSPHPWRHLIHGPLSFLASLPILLLPTETKLLIANNQDVPEDQATLFVTCILILIVWLLLQTSLYTIYGWRLLARYQKRLNRDFGTSGTSPLHWMRWVMMSLTGVYGIYAVNQISAILDIYTSDWLNAGVTLAQVMMVFALGYRGLRSPVLFMGSFSPDETPPESQAALIRGGPSAVSPAAPGYRPAMQSAPDMTETDQRSPVDPELAASVATRLLDTMKRDSLYLDPLLTLPRLALKTGTSANTVSAVLNQHLGVNFFDFVNSYRVDDAGRLLIADPDRTVLDIAMDVGFNSKSTFNAAFKKHTGTTPTLWRKERSNVNA